MTKKKSKYLGKRYFNGKHKDFLFRYILSNKRVLLELYNALNGTEYRNPDDLIINTLEDVVYLGYKNDLSFLIGNTLNLYEHQSTVNPNMPLRGLLYMAALYESYVTMQGENLYGAKQIPLPFPQYIVFINAEKEMPEQQVLRLSDAFQKVSGEGSGRSGPCLEVTATMLNINHGHNQEILNKCSKLEEYTIFVERVRFYLNKNKDIREALEWAMDDCIDNDILKDILLKNKAEVTRMLLTEFDARKYKKQLRKEAKEEGWEEGRKEGMEAGMAAGMEAGMAAGMEAGMEAGIATGMEVGITRLNKLNAYLLKEGKMDELERSISDQTFQQDLLKQYNIE